MRKIFSLMLIVLACLTAKAQTTRYLRGGTEISSNMVNHIYQDKDGMVWISTDNGLNRMDGAKNTVYYSEKDNNSNFCGFYEDSKRRKFACASEHVMIFDTKSETLNPIKAYKSDGEEVKFRAYDLIETHDGNIYTYTAGYGILRLEIKNGEMCFRQDRSKIPYYYITDLMEDSKHRLWAGTEKGIVCWDGKRLHHIKCDRESIQRHFADITEAADGSFWAASRVDGIWRINPNDLTMRQTDALRGVSVTSILAKVKGEILVGTNGQGIYALNTVNESIHQFSFPVGPYSSNQMNVHTMMSDHDGNLWAGCFQKGAVILRHQESRYHYIGHNSPVSNVIGSNCINGITRDKNGILWVASDGDGLYAVDDHNKGQGPLSSKHYDSSNGIPNTVIALHSGSDGRIWIGTWMHGLYALDPNSGQCKQIDIPTKEKEALSVFSFADDGYGHLWIGTMGQGLFYIDKATGKATAAPTPKDGVFYDEKQNIVHNKWINSVDMGDDGILWIATCDGVGAIDVNTKNCLRGLRGKNRILEGINVNTVHQARTGLLWIGSSKGLMSYDPSTGKTKSYSRSEGLEGNSVQGIVETGDGTLWISTNLGISSYKDGKFFNYSSSNGMHGNEFTKNACYLDADGQVYFGGTEGICYFFPDQMTLVGNKPTVMFSALYLNGQAVNGESQSGDESIMDTDIIHTKSIELSASDNSFVLELSSLNFVQAECVLYEYRLDEDSWVSLPMGMNTISFTNLPSGTHTLEVRAKEWNSYSDVKKIEIIVRSPWYRTFWAYLFYLIVATGMAWALIQHTHQRRQAMLNEIRLKQQEEISEAKLQFFMNISHEIRTPMTLIVSPLQRLLQTDLDAKRQSAYHLMHRNAQRILQLVNQLLDVRKIDKGLMKLYFQETEMVAYVRNLTEGFRDLCDTKNISIAFSSNSNELMAWIDPMNFDKIIVNILSNAFKYTPKDGQISVEVNKVDGQKYTIKVTDTGRGMTQEELHHIFDRFYQHNNPENQVVQGSGVGMNLTRSLVKLHHGSIAAMNNVDGPGCNFVVTLPLGNAHLQEDERATANAVASDQKVVHDEKTAALLAAETIMPDAQDDITEHTEKAKGNSDTPAVSEAKVVEAHTDVLPLTEEKRPMGGRKMLLIVEDDAEIQSYLNAELSAVFNILRANNGAEAIEILHKHTPDIIISDVMMPVMNGIELLKKIRQNTLTNNIPVILLTAKTSEHDNIEGLSEGADVYMTKPFSIEILRRTAMNLVQRQQQLKNIYDGRQTPTVDKVHITSPDERLMQRIMKVVNANLSNPELGNELLTREVGISRVHLYRKLKEMTNLSLRDFIKNIRLTEAARLLSEHRHSITEVAESTGFDNVSYFTVVFKQKYGVPPSVYMNQSHDSDEIPAPSAEEENQEEKG